MPKSKITTVVFTTIPDQVIVSPQKVMKSTEGITIFSSDGSSSFYPWHRIEAVHFEWESTDGE